MNAPVELIDKLVSFDEDHTDSADGPKLVIHHQQHIPDEHISQLKRAKIDTLHTPAGDFHRVCSIPTGIYEAWLREGYDASKEDIRTTLARLRKHDMDAFITTNKRI